MTNVLVTCGASKALVSVTGGYRSLVRECVALWPEAVPSDAAYAVSLPFGGVAAADATFVVCNPATWDGCVALLADQDVVHATLVQLRAGGGAASNTGGGARPSRVEASSSSSITAAPVIPSKPAQRTPQPPPVSPAATGSQQPTVDQSASPIVLGTFVDGSTESAAMKFDIPTSKRFVDLHRSVLRKLRDTVSVNIVMVTLAFRTTSSPEIDIDDDDDVAAFHDAINKFGEKSVRLRVYRAEAGTNALAPQKILAAMPSSVAAGRPRSAGPSRPTSAASSTTPGTRAAGAVLATPLQRDAMSPVSIAKSVDLD